MPEQQSADLLLLVSREQAENEFRKALNLYVGRGRRYSVAQLAKGSGVPTRVIDCFRSYAHGHPDYRRLHFGQVLSMTAFLGAEFTNEWLTLSKQAAYDLPDEEPDPGELAADTSESASRVVRMAADRDFTNDSETDLRDTGTSLMNQGAQLVAIGSRRKRRAA